MVQTWNGEKMILKFWIFLVDHFNTMSGYFALCPQEQLHLSESIQPSTAVSAKPWYAPLSFDDDK